MDCRGYPRMVCAIIDYQLCCGMWWPVEYQWAMYKKGYIPVRLEQQRVTYFSVWGAVLHAGSTPRTHVPAPQPHAEGVWAECSTIFLFIFTRGTRLDSGAEKYSL